MALRSLRIPGISTQFVMCDTGYSSLAHAVYLAYSLNYGLNGELVDTNDPVLLAKLTGKAVYTYDSVTSEVVRYSASGYVGCVMCCLDTNNKWWTIARYNDKFELVTAFSMYSDTVSMFDDILIDSVEVTQNTSTTMRVDINTCSACG